MVTFGLGGVEIVFWESSEYYKTFSTFYSKILLLGISFEDFSENRELHVHDEYVTCDRSV